MNRKINNQKFNNIQKNIKISAGGNVNTGIINNQEDNSWYSIPKENSGIYETLGKFIISKLGEKGGFFSAILSIIVGGIVGLSYTFVYLLNFGTKIKYTNINNKGGISQAFINLTNSINIEWLIAMIGYLLIGAGFLIYRSIEYKNNSKCPKCKTPYALVEVGKSKEKEIKTSKGYRISQIRNYKCSKCNFEKTEESNFIKPLNQQI